MRPRWRERRGLSRGNAGLLDLDCNSDLRSLFHPALEGTSLLQTRWPPATSQTAESAGRLKGARLMITPHSRTTHIPAHPCAYSAVERALSHPPRPTPCACMDTSRVKNENPTSHKRKRNSRQPAPKLGTATNTQQQPGLLLLPPCLSPSIFRRPLHRVFQVSLLGGALPIPRPSCPNQGHKSGNCAHITAAGPAAPPPHKKRHTRGKRVRGPGDRRSGGSCVFGAARRIKVEREALLH